MCGPNNFVINTNYSYLKKDTMVFKNQLKIKKVHPRAQMPEYKTAGAAGFDVRAILEEGEQATVYPGKSVKYRTGLAFEIPEGWVMLAFSRSGMGFSHDLRLSNCVGVIDSDYRGELFVKLAYDGTDSYTVVDQERVLQCVLVPAPQFKLVEVTELSETERGENGSGSTGKL